MNLDLTILLTVIGTGVAVIGTIYEFFRNFKIDINANIDRLEKRMDSFEKRIDSFENKIISLEERMFWMATGKKLEDAILEEKNKREREANPKTDP